MTAAQPDATIEDMFETVFSVLSVPTLYTED
jgi:hypothetical protein